jgi:ectoine hydroxylase-related dioxygenase (phytanoyl-CoA dioxygenase family)
MRKSKQKPDYTLTYYSKMPENLEGNDGCIIFKDEEENEFSVLPKEGDLLIFGADVLHRAATNINSIDERIVFCANFAFLDINKEYNKKQKTLI